MTDRPFRNATAVVRLGTGPGEVVEIEIGMLEPGGVSWITRDVGDLEILSVAYRSDGEDYERDVFVAAVPRERMLIEIGADEFTVTDLRFPSK